MARRNNIFLNNNENFYFTCSDDAVRDSAISHFERFVSDYEFQVYISRIT